MSAGFLNPAAGLGASTPSDPTGDLIARQKLAELLSGGKTRYNDASPKQHWMQALAQVADGAMEGLSARQQLAAALAGQSQANNLLSSMPAATAAAAQGTASARAASSPRAAISIPGQLGSLDDRNLDLAVRTAMAEAGGMGAPGMRDVAAVLRNRALLSGKSVADEALAPNQFEPWNPGSRNDPRRFKADSPEYQAALAAIRPILDGTEADPTGGATHFYAPRAQAQLGRRPPSWDDGTGEDRGGHRFFRHSYAGKDPASLAQASAPQRPAAQAAAGDGTAIQTELGPVAFTPSAVPGDTVAGAAGADSLGGSQSQDDLRTQLEAAFEAQRARGQDLRADMPVEGAEPTSFLTAPRDPNGGFFIPPEVRATAPAGDPSAPRPGDAPPAPAPAAPDIAALTAAEPMGPAQRFAGSATGAPAAPAPEPTAAAAPQPPAPVPAPTRPAPAPARSTRSARAQIAETLAEPAPAQPQAPPAPQQSPREGLAAILGGMQDGLDRVFGGAQTQARLDTQGAPSPWGPSDGRGGLINRLLGLDEPSRPAPAQRGGPVSPPPQPTSFSSLPGTGPAPRAVPPPAPQGGPQSGPAPAPMRTGSAPAAPPALQQVAQASAPAAAPQTVTDGQDAQVAWAKQVMAASAANPAVAKLVPVAQEILKQGLTPKMAAPFDYEGGKVQRDPQTGEYKWVVKPGDAGEKYQHVSLPNGGVFAFNPANPDSSKIILPGQPARPLTPEERTAFGIPSGQGAMMGPEGPKAIGGGGTTVNVDTKGAGKFTEVANAKQAERYAKMMEAADEAVSIRGDIDTLADLGSKIATGRLSEAKLGIAQYAKALGADDLANSLTGGKMSEMEAYQAIADKLAPRMRVPGSGATSDYEMRVFRNSLPSLLKTPGGNAIAVDTFRSLYDYQAAVGDIAGQALRGEIPQKDADAQIRALESPFLRFKEYRKEAARGETSAAPAPAAAPASPGGQRIRRYNPATGTLE